MRLLRNSISDIVAIITSGWVLFHLFMIAEHGTFWIAEGNPYILYSEIVLLSAVLIFQIWRFIDTLKEINGTNTERQ